MAISEKNVESLRKTIEEQKKVLTFFQKRFKEQTGNELELPQTWSKFLSISDANAPLADEQHKMMEEQHKQEMKDLHSSKNDNFLQAYYDLKLPKKKLDPKKKTGSLTKSAVESGSGNARGGDKGISKAKKKKDVTTTFDASNYSHMVQKIDLSGFKGKNISRAALREMIEGVEDMRCLNTMILKGNGIDDEYIEEIEMLLSNERITTIDLSTNEIGKLGAQAIARKLKETNHLVWLNLSHNAFTHEETLVNQVIASVKNHKNLFHFEMNAAPMRVSEAEDQQKPAFKCSEQMISLFASNPKLVSLSLRDSSITHKAMEDLEKHLRNPAKRIVHLNFQYCFLDDKNIFTLCRGLTMNRSLVKLDLSKNGLPPLSGIRVLKVIRDSMSVTTLDLSKNNLNDFFAEELAKCLEVNDVLWKVDISHNPISPVGAKSLLKVLKEKNDTVTSFGDLESNVSMGILTIRSINICLETNKSNCEGIEGKKVDKQKLSQEEPIQLQSHLSMSEFRLQSSQMDYEGYLILKPLSYLNNPVKTLGDFRLWNV